MRTVFTLTVGAIVLSSLALPAFADDEKAIAVKLLQGAFACPSPSDTDQDPEDDQYVTTIRRSNFISSESGFQITIDVKMLADVSAVDSSRVGPSETHKHWVYTGIYSDIRSTDIFAYDGDMGSGRSLAINCAGKHKCLHISYNQDFGDAYNRTREESVAMSGFFFCSEQELQNAKAAFDALIRK